MWTVRTVRLLSPASRRHQHPSVELPSNRQLYHTSSFERILLPSNTAPTDCNGAAAACLIVSIVTTPKLPDPSLRAPPPPPVSFLTVRLAPCGQARSRLERSRTLGYLGHRAASARSNHFLLEHPWGLGLLSSFICRLAAIRRQGITMWNDEDNNPYGNSFDRRDSFTSSTANPSSPIAGQ